VAVVFSSAKCLFVAGWVGLTDRPAKRDAGITTMLRRLGAVLYVKTNIPQSLMVRGIPNRANTLRCSNLMTV
jgi:Asp-tRNA(Asn)/Glu-tRNA(Gln) amidotransferase A subunit family amidase